MHETDMAVVVSQSQNGIKEMEEKGLDIAPPTPPDGQGSVG